MNNSVACGRVVHKTACGFGSSDADCPWCRGGHLWRQFGKVKNRRLSFLKTLTENLYFKSLNNNSGAIQQLLDTVADEEIKEVFLAYSFLLINL